MMDMTGHIKHIFLVAVCSMAACAAAYAQGPDRKDVRKGNRDFKKEDYKAAEIDYRKALVKDSLSFAAGYNLGNTLYRTGDKEQAGKIYQKMQTTAAVSPHAADYYYNVGNVACDAKDWQAAVDAYKQSLLRNPSDMDAKENYIYAKQMLKNQQNQGGGGGQNQQDQDQNKDNQDNNDQQNQGQDNKDQNGKDNQDQNQNQNQNQDQNNGQDRQDQGQNPQGQQAKITPQAAQQILQAIQAKEKETQDKVKKEKAQVLKSRQKEKNW